MKRQREKRTSVKTMERTRKGYCKKDNNQETILKSLYVKDIDDNEFKFNKLDADTYNHCNKCEYIKKCKLYSEM